MIPLIGLVLLSACGEAGEGPSSIQRMPTGVPACGEDAASGPVVLDTIAVDLETPWDVTFLPDGRALVTERAGRIRVVSPEGELRDEPWATLDVFAEGESGLMGIDAAPDFAETGHVLVVRTLHDDHGMTGLRSFYRKVRRRIARLLDPQEGYYVQLEVVRLRDAPGADGGRGVEPTTLAVHPSGLLHGGGALRFGPGGFLYFTTGDTGVPELAASADSRRGRVMRYRYEKGAIEPAGGDGSPRYARGIRHAQGVAWRSAAEPMYLIDHGPTGLPQERHRTGNDELNQVVPGADLGWPTVAGGSVSGGPPSMVWNPAIAPAGLEFYDDPGSRWHGDAFVTALRGRSLRRLTIDEADGGVGCEEVLLEGALGRLRLVRQAPDGDLWVGTSNRDGRGSPRPQDDVLVRVRPGRDR